MSMTYLSGVVTLEYREELCRGCGRCVEVCPREVFVMEGRRAALLDRDRCIECGACALNCPEEAIQVRAGVGCAAAVLNGLLTGGEPSCGCGGDCSPEDAVAQPGQEPVLYDLGGEAGGRDPGGREAQPAAERQAAGSCGCGTGSTGCC